MHKEKLAATHMCCQNILREKMMRRDDARIKAKHVANIKVVRIYGERERARALRSGHAYMQNMAAVRNIWRKKKKRSIWTHAYMQEYHMG